MSGVLRRALAMGLTRAATSQAPAGASITAAVRVASLAPSSAAAPLASFNHPGAG